MEGNYKVWPASFYEEENMKAQKRISYSPDVDILMIQLSDKKVDDSYETENSVVSVDKNGEPVLLEIFHGKQYLKELGKSLPKEIKREFTTQPTAVAHQIRK